MKKRILSSINLLCCSGLLSTSCVLSSCHSKKEHKISLPSNTFEVNQHNFNVPAYFNFSPKDAVSINLEGNNPNIQLESQTEYVHDGLINLFFKIDESVQSDFNFFFDIKFSYHNKSGKQFTYIIYDVVVAFSTEEPTEYDNVWLSSNLVSVTNSHIFEFVCNFAVKPISNVIKLSLSQKSSNRFDLQKEEYEIDYSGDSPHINLQIELDMEVFKKSEYSFNLNVEFINSYAQQQTMTFEDCVIQYDRDVNDDVPFDYLNLEKVENDNWILHGLKPNIPQIEAGKYIFLTIPGNVVSIDKNAFSDENWFKGIRTINIPDSVSEIGESAFSGLLNIYQINLLDYVEGKEPEWYKSNISIFNGNQMKYDCGYIWIPDNLEKKSNFESWNLPKEWQAFQSSEVASDDFFDMDGDKTIIHGINLNRIQDLPKIKVIKLPDTIQTIGKSAFKQLKDVPYYNSKENRYETRRIFLSKNLQTVSSNEFLTSGIAGPIFFRSSEFQLLPMTLFEYCNDYNYPPLEPVYTENTKLFFADSLKLSVIAKRAFNHVNAIGTLELPVAISSVLDFAFLDTGFEKIIFNNNCNNVGEEAFGNTSFFPPSPQLKVIDLTRYNTIKNPGEETPTYQPEWFSQTDLAFIGACANGGKVVINQKMSEEAEVSKDIDKWFETFRTNHSIPDDWQLEIVQDPTGM